ncbi:MAG: HD-GYP domain-containing protein [Methylophilaceae bacterium]
MNVKIEINAIKCGMYVSELDRPWTDSTFLFQGFLIENDEQIRELQEQCSYVIVSQERSSPDIFPSMSRVVEPVTRPQAAPKTDTFISRTVSTEQNKNAKTGLFGFLSTAVQIGKELFSTKPSATAELLQDQDRAALDAQERMEEIRQQAAVASLRKNFSQQTGITGKISHYAIEASIKEEIAPAQNAAIKFEQEFTSNMLLEMTGVSLSERIEVAKDLLVDVVDSIIRNPNAMMLISRLKNIDANSYRHAMDVSIMMISFGRQLGLPKAELNSLGLGALLHDIGKSKVDQLILEKPGKLSGEEYEEVKKHVNFGVEILQETGKLNKVERMIVERHHERYDGQGYPNGLVGEDIGLYGSMAAIVETYASITTEQFYESARSSAKAISTIMALRGKAFHPELVDQFAQVVGMYPIGSIVKLNTGEVGLVLEQNKLWRLKPVITILVAANGKKLPRPLMLDLANAPLLDANLADPNLALAIVDELPVGSFGIDLKDYFL